MQIDAYFVVSFSLCVVVFLLAQIVFTLKHVNRSIPTAVKIRLVAVLLLNIVVPLPTIWLALIPQIAAVILAVVVMAATLMHDAVFLKKWGTGK